MSDFGERFLLARYATGGVIVDLESGNYYRINDSAALVCGALLGPDPETQVSKSLGISRSDAESLVAEVRLGLSGPPIRELLDGWTHVFPTSGGYVLRDGDRPLLEVVESGHVVRIPSGALPETLLIALPSP